MIQAHPTGRFLRRGNAVLDMALVLPILLSLAFGTIEFGYYFFVKNSLQGAAREGARAAIVSGAQYADINTAVSVYLTSAGIRSYTVTVQKNGATLDAGAFNALAAGDPVTVTVQARWGDVGINSLGIISSNKQVAGTTVMRKEG